MPDTQISEALGLIDGGLQLLLAAVHADDPKREMLVRVGDLLRDVGSLQAALSGHVVGWRTMDSAPKDGTWFLAYRPPLEDWETLVAVCWDKASNDFVWPTENYDAYDPPDLSEHDAAGFLEVDVYESQGSFTHWQPLPAPPEMEG